MSRELAEGLSRYFQSLLGEEGFNRGEIRWDDDSKTSDLVFKYEGGNYLLVADADDEAFVRVIFPNFWPLESDAECAAALQAISIVNSRCKAAKVYTTNDNSNVVAAVEFLISPDQPNLSAKLFIRYLGMLKNGADEFVKIMREFMTQQ